MDVITQQDSLNKFCAEAAKRPFICVDTEFMRETTFFSQLCLIQAATDEDEAIIDPLADGLDLKPFLDILTNPEIIKGLLGAKNGWFMYTPLMLIACLAFFVKGMAKDIRIVFFLLVPVYIYIVYAWFNYYYINGFGSRPMIHLYPLLAFGIL